MGESQAKCEKRGTSSLAVVLKEPLFIWPRFVLVVG